MSFRTILSALFFAFALTGVASDAVAQAVGAACARLESQLAVLQRSGGEAQYREFDTAARQQRAEYDRSMQVSRQMGCTGGGFLFFRPTPNPQCGSINANLERMAANLSRLEARRAQYDPRQSVQERNQVLQALAGNNCGPQYRQFVARAAPQQGGFFGLFTQQQQLPDWRDDLFIDIPRVGTFRTVCARTCDGYFFPISFSTVRSQFANDEAACQARCPGTDVALYAYRSPGGAIEEATNTAGGYYVDLPTAFAYRQTYNPSCGCRSAGGGEAANYTPVAPDAVAQRLNALRSVVPVPVARPAIGVDPETAANRLGAFIPRPVTVKPPDAIAAITGEAGMRLIGPAYFYAQ